MTKDPVEAGLWWKRCSEYGYPPSMHALAAAYMSSEKNLVLRCGGGLQAQLDTATELMVKAARQGYIPSQQCKLANRIKWSHLRRLRATF